MPAPVSVLGREGVRAAAAWVPPPSKWEYARSDLDLSKQAWTSRNTLLTQLASFEVCLVF